MIHKQLLCSVWTLGAGPGDIFEDEALAHLLRVRVQSGCVHVFPSQSMGN